MTEIKFGRRTYTIRSANWDSENHVGRILVNDDLGETYLVDSYGLAPDEQRRSVADFALKLAAARQAVAES
jgi:hypothetical protein